MPERSPNPSNRLAPFEPSLRLGSLGWVWLTVASSTACGTDAASGGRGGLDVLLEAEETITAGLSAGDRLEDVRDGWNVAFEKYVVVLGNIQLQLATDPDVRRGAEALYAVDLVQLPASGLALWQLSDLASARWDFGYAVGPGASASSVQRHDSVSPADFDELVASGWAYLIQGSIESTSGRACPPRALAQPPSGLAAVATDADGNPCYAHARVGFRFGVALDTTYVQCRSDGLLGVAVPDGSRSTVAVTIHGDHMFFNGFPSGDEGGVLRLAQWLADSDLDLDGEVTREELESLALSDLAVIDERYQTGGRARPIANLWDYLVQQLEGQGHFQGEGECVASAR